MKSHIRNGLIVGGVAFVINFGVSIAFGICGPFVSLVGGIVAGFLTARSEAHSPDVVSLSAISGGISGSLSIISQMIAAMIAITLVVQSGRQPAFGYLPTENDPAALQTLLWVSALGTGLCFGVIGALLSGGAAALTAYTMTRNTPPPAPALASEPAPSPAEGEAGED